jgi:hypothetical protein
MTLLGDGDRGKDKDEEDLRDQGELFNLGGLSGNLHLESQYVLYSADILPDVPDESDPQNSI